MKWEEIDKVNEMNTATLGTWTTGCEMWFRFGMLHRATKDHNCDLYIYEARRDCPPKLHGCAEHLKIKFKASFNFFLASALRVLEAGFDLNTQGPLVKGSMPFFAGVAAFFNIPASLKFPFFSILLVATAKRDQLFDGRLSDCPVEWSLNSTVLSTTIIITLQKT